MWGKLQVDKFLCSLQSVGLWPHLEAVSLSLYFCYPGQVLTFCIRIFARDLITQPCQVYQSQEEIVTILRPPLVLTHLHPRPPLVTISSQKSIAQSRWQVSSEVTNVNMVTSLCHPITSVTSSGHLRGIKAQCLQIFWISSDTGGGTSWPVCHLTPSLPPDNSCHGLIWGHTTTTLLLSFRLNSEIWISYFSIFSLVSVLSGQLSFFFPSE